jgi:hypothetical protein
VDRRTISLGSIKVKGIMNLTLPLTAAEESTLVAQARAKGTTPEALVRQAIEPILTAVPENLPETKNPSRHISELIAERMKTLPSEVFERLPKDGASEHDHYLYGHPKRNQ